MKREPYSRLIEVTSRTITRIVGDVAIRDRTLGGPRRPLQTRRPVVGAAIYPRHYFAVCRIVGQRPDVALFDHTSFACEYRTIATEAIVACLGVEQDHCRQARIILQTGIEDT